MDVSNFLNEGYARRPCYRAAPAASPCSMMANHRGAAAAPPVWQTDGTLAGISCGDVAARRNRT